MLIKRKRIFTEYEFYDWYYDNEFLFRTTTYVQIDERIKFKPLNLN